MRRDRYIYLGLLLAVAAAYWPVVYCGYTNYDDWAYASENPLVQHGLTWTGICWACRAMVIGNWHPVTLLSHMAVSQFFGVTALPHHLANLLLHAANALLLFYLLRRMTGERWPSALVAAFFALHPLHVESVAWISERKDVLSTFFGLLSLLMYVSYVRAGKAKEEGGRRNAEVGEPKQEGAKGIKEPSETSAPIPRHRGAGLCYGLSLFFFALGLMSKPMLVTWPFVLALLDYWPLRRWAKPAGEASRSPLPLRGSQADARRGKKTGRSNPEPAFAIRPARFAILDKLPFLALSIASCIITMVVQHAAGAIPDSGQITLSMRVDNALVSYVLYLGKTFWPHPLAIYYPYHADWGDGAVLGSGMLLGFVSVLAWQLRKSRPYWIVGWLWFLGTLVPVIGLVQVGSQSMADRYIYIPSIGLGVMLVWAARDLMRTKPFSRPVWRRAAAGVTIAALLSCGVATGMQLRYWRNGEALFRHCLEVTPDNMMAEYGLGEALVKTGKFDAGLRHFQRAVSLKPDCFQARARIADLLSREGRIGEAIDQYHLALKDAPDLAAALNNLAWILATSEDPQFRNGEEALDLAKRACKTIQYQQPVQVPTDLDTLAAALAELGRFDSAVKVEQNARSVALTLGQRDRAGRIEQTIQLYLAHKPLRQAIPRLGQKPPAPAPAESAPGTAAK